MFGRVSDVDAKARSVAQGLLKQYAQMRVIDDDFLEPGCGEFVQVPADERPASSREQGFGQGIG